MLFDHPQPYGELQLAVVGGILAIIILPAVFLTRKVHIDTDAQQGKECAPLGCNCRSNA
jgi:hypothetical protein